MASNIYEDVEDELQVVENDLKYSMGQFDQYFKGIAPGYHRPNDFEFMMFVQQMRQKFPPIPMVDPDGRPVRESPYIQLWKHGVNSKDDWERLQRLQPGGAP